MPRGCMIVLAAPTAAPDDDAARELLAGLRQADRRHVRRRIARGVSDGELPASTDVIALADHAVTILHGLSIQARDGATVTALNRVIDVAMLGWDALVRRGGTLD